MKQIVTAVLLPFFLGLMLSGCGAEDTAFLERTMAASEDGGAASEHMESEEGTEAPSSGRKQRKEPPEPCYVYVCGAVQSPGVYEMQQGDRIFQAVALAGGLTEDAGPELVNQAEPIADGQMIRIPTKEEAAAWTASGEGPGEGGGASSYDAFRRAGSDGGTGGTGESAEEDGLLDLNQASAAELMTLPGIGQAKADSIVAYRQEHGSFSSTEELMCVNGIKEGVYNRIRDYIKVK